MWLREVGGGGGGEQFATGRLARTPHAPKILDWNDVVACGRCHGCNVKLISLRTFTVASNLQSVPVGPLSLGCEDAPPLPPVDVHLISCLLLWEELTFCSYNGQRTCWNYKIRGVTYFRQRKFSPKFFWPKFLEMPWGRGRPPLRVMDVRAQILVFPGFWRPWPKFWAGTSARMTQGCPRDVRLKNFLFGLIFRSWYLCVSTQLELSSVYAWCLTNSAFIGQKKTQQGEDFKGKPENLRRLWLFFFWALLGGSQAFSRKPTQSWPRTRALFGQIQKIWGTFGESRQTVSVGKQKRKQKIKRPRIAIPRTKTGRAFCCPRCNFPELEEVFEWESV